MTKADFITLTQELISVQAIMADGKRVEVLLNPAYVVSMAGIEHATFGKVIAIRTINSELFVDYPPLETQAP